jgi:hypothetical protein
MHNDDENGLPKDVKEPGEIEWHFVKSEDQTNSS